MSNLRSCGSIEAFNELVGKVPTLAAGPCSGGQSLDDPEKFALRSGDGAIDERTMSYMPEARANLSEGI